MATSNSYLYNIQFLTDNFLVEEDSSIDGFSSKPITYKFGGSTSENPQIWDIAESEIAASKTDLTYFRGNGLVLDIDLQEQKRSTNALFRLSTISSQNLYMVGWDSAFLSTFDRQTGRATVVGDAPVGFGVGEDYPTGIAWHENKMYMVGRRTSSLHVLDLRTGQAERVGSATRFGVNEDFPAGLASHNGTLYMIGQDTRSLHKLSVTTGEATESFTLSEEDSIPSGLASHGGRLYMVGVFTRALYLLDPFTGNLKRVGDADSFGVNEIGPTGLASYDGTLYMFGRSDVSLYILNTSTGEAIDASDVAGFGINERNPWGMSYGEFSGGEIPGADWQAIIECNVSTEFPTSYDAENDYTPDDIFYLRRVSPEYFYVNLPRNLSYQYYRIKLFDPEMPNLTKRSETTTAKLATNQKPRYNPTLPLYELLYMDGGGYLYAVDAGSAIGQRVTSIEGFGVGVNYAVIAHHNDVYYMAPRSKDRNTFLYTLDLSTGEATRVRNAPEGFGIISYFECYGLESHNGTLYMTGYDGGDSTALYTLNPNTGVATKVADTSADGDLASHNGILYAIDSPSSEGDRLYTLNTTTGVATQVGSAFRFGVNEYGSTGLASLGGNLYMCGDETDRLYRLNTTTGVATRVGTASWDLLGLFPGSMTSYSSRTRPSLSYIPPYTPSSDSQLYALFDGRGALYTLDVTTGVARRIGTVTGFGVGDIHFTGLASHSGTLYMIARGALYTVDPYTSVATRVGSASEFGVRETSAQGLASHNGTLYMVGFGNDVLYTLNTTTGRATRIGSATNFGVSESGPSGLASHNGTLYMVGQSNEALYTLSTSTGRATRVGSSTAFGVSENIPNGLASFGGNLYMFGRTNSVLYRLSTSTGRATRVGSATQFGVDGFSPIGLTSHTPSAQPPSTPTSPLPPLASPAARGDIIDPPLPSLSQPLPGPKDFPAEYSVYLSDIFLGDSVDVDRAPARGLVHQTVDPSVGFVAESGRKYYLKKPYYQQVSEISLPLLKRWQVSALKIWSDRVGVTDPFWAILDPHGCFDGPMYGATFGVFRLVVTPTFTHEFGEYWSANLSIEEAL